MARYYAMMQKMVIRDDEEDGDSRRIETSGFLYIFVERHPVSLRDGIEV